MTPLVVVSTVLNAGELAERCIESVKRQTVRAHHVYVDAASTDDTQAHAERAAWGDPLVHYRRNTKRLGVLENLAGALHDLAVPDESIVVWLDGDDQLAVDGAIERVLAEYANGEVWLTFGSFMYADGRKGFAQSYPAEVVTYGAYRRAPWYATHLKTFRAGLFRAIPPEYLRDAAGKLLDLALDQAVMFPMLEMAAERARFIPDILYVYNYAHSFESKASADGLARERDVCLDVRGRAPLKRLERAPWSIT